MVKQKTCEPTPSAAAIAAEVVLERRVGYGSPRKNFERLAQLFTVVLQDKLSAPISPADVALLMIQLKVSRLCETPDHFDSWVDIAGYADCGGEVTR
jgi:hypothetical protein